MVLVDYNSRQPLPDQKLELGKYIDMLVNMNPGETPEDPSYRDKGNAFAMISTLEPENYRVAWTAAMYPNFVLRTVRIQALSIDEATGMTKYENREAFGGILAYVVKFLAGEKLVKGFAGAANSLKKHAEKKWYPSLPFFLRSPVIVFRFSYDFLIPLCKAIRCSTGEF